MQSQAERALRVDRTALKVNQLGIVGFVALAFVLDAAWLVALVALALVLGAAWPAAGPFRLAYGGLLRPSGLLRPEVVEEDPAPHRFAIALGAVCLVLASLLFALGATAAGWALAGLVAVLAGINLLAGFCLGCFIHYQLARRGLIRSSRRQGYA